MSEYIIQGQTLTGIADAIRAQLGTEQQYTPESMAAAIGSIQGEGNPDDFTTPFVERSLKGSFENNSATIVGTSAFVYMTGLKSAKLQRASTIGSNGFQQCLSLNECIIPKCTRIGSYAFNGCISLTKFFAPAKQISGGAFSNSAILHFVLTGDSICKLTSTNTFNSSPIASGTGFVYVKDDLVSQYKVETNWSAIASQIKGWAEIPAEILEWINQNGEVFLHDRRTENQ